MREKEKIKDGGGVMQKGKVVRLKEEEAGGEETEKGKKQGKHKAGQI